MSRLGARPVVWQMRPSRRGVLRAGLMTAAAAAGGAGVAWPPPARITDALAATACPPAAGAARWAFGTELEYYRMDPARIPARLDLCVEVGFTRIQTYVPWNVHENLQGAIDFAGATHPVIVSDHVDEYQIQTPDDEVRTGGAASRVVANTDLVGFLEQCARRGLEVVLRPGPFISDEWRNGGLPDWLLVAGYPDMYQRGPDGTPLTPGFPFSGIPAVVTGGGPLFYFPALSYASSAYLDVAARWLRDFAAVIRPHLASRGGPVVGFQVDDETCFFYRFGVFEVDYHPQTVAAYRARFGSDPPSAWPAPGSGTGALLPALHWQRFKASQIAGYLGSLAGTLRQAGMEGPITQVHELTLQPPAGFAELAHSVTVNAEFYEDAGPWSVPLNELCAQAARAASRHVEPVIAAEMSNGDPLLLALLMGEGLKGGMQFNYTDGVADADVPVLRPFGRTLRTAGSRLLSTRRRADTAIVWCPELGRMPYGADRYGFRHDLRAIAERHVPALAALLVRAGLSFDLLDTTVALAADYRQYQTVWLVCGDLLPRATQRDLVDYVDNGGRLVCWPEPPRLDEELNACTVLGDALYPEATAGRRPADDQVITVLGGRARVWRGVQTFALSPAAEAIAVTADAKVCGYRRRHGGGEALLLGTWLAADSVPGRAGSILQIEQVPAGVTAAETAASLLAHSAADGVPVAALAGAAGLVPDNAEYVMIYADTNQRRGGELISGGCLAYWDGSDAVCVRQVNTAETAPAVEALPHHPIGADHVAAALRLHGSAPLAPSGDPMVQVRVLDDTETGAVTVVVLNRRTDDAHVAITLEAGGRSVRLPRVGALRIPPLTPLLLPVDYSFGGGVSIIQSTAQLLEAGVAPGAASFSFLAPAGGEVVLRIPGSPRTVTIDGHAAPATITAAEAGATLLTLPLDPGEHIIAMSWDAAAVTCGREAAAASASLSTLPGTGAPRSAGTGVAAAVALVGALIAARRLGPHTDDDLRDR